MADAIFGMLMTTQCSFIHCVFLAGALQPATIQEGAEVLLLWGRSVEIADWGFFQSCGFSSPTFRIGGESLAVAQNTYAVSWFKGKELNLVFGLQLSMARIVSMAPDLVRPNRKQAPGSCLLRAVLLGLHGR